MDLSFKLKSTGLVASPRTALFHLELRIPDVEDAARVYIEDVLIAETTESLVAVGQVYLLRGPCTQSRSNITNQQDQPR